METQSYGIEPIFGMIMSNSFQIISEIAKNMGDFRHDNSFGYVVKQKTEKKRSDIENKIVIAT